MVLFQKNGNSIVIVSIDEEIKKIMKVLTLDKQFKNCSSMDEALEHFKN